MVRSDEKSILFKNCRYKNRQHNNSNKSVSICLFIIKSERRKASGNYSFLTHSPICACIPSIVGNPFVRCSGNQSKPQMIKMHPENHSYPEPCGRNTICFRENGVVACKCRNDPNKSCTASKCVDPCPGVCSAEEDCYVFNHKASCRPKSSRSECTSNNDCPSDKACYGYKCPATADCQIVNQNPNFVCQRERIGSPYQYCEIHPFGEMF